MFSPSHAPPSDTGTGTDPLEMSETKLVKFSSLLAMSVMKPYIWENIRDARQPVQPSTLRLTTWLLCNVGVQSGLANQTAFPAPTHPRVHASTRTEIRQRLAFTLPYLNRCRSTFHSTLEIAPSHHLVSISHRTISVSPPLLAADFLVFSFFFP